MNPERTKWQIDYYPAGGKGKRDRLTYYGKEADARALELDLRRQYANDVPANPRILDAMPDWSKWCKNNYATTTYDDVKKALKYLIAFFGNRFFTHLTPMVIEDYKSQRLETGVCKRTANKELTYFSSFVKWSAKNGFCKPLPFDIEQFPNVSPPEPQILHVEEVEKIIKGIEPKYQPIILLYYDSGLRKTEALRLKAEKVDLKNRTIIILGKGGKEKTIPILTDRLYEALESLIKQIPSGYLFINHKTGRPFTSIKKAIIRAAERANISKRVYTHLLRHCFGTHGIEAGINTRAMQGLLRHATIKTTEKYTHLSTKYLAAEGKKFQEYVSSHKRQRR
jgi:site-specific recombinase XerD